MTVPAPALGVDIGATKVMACLVGPDGVVLDETVAPTPPRSPDLVDLIAALGRRLAGSSALVAVGLSVAGWVDRDRRTVTFSPHLELRGVELSRLVGTELGLPAVMDNDANAAAWAEYRFGAGVDSGGEMALITVGSGVGGGFVTGGRLLRGGNGMAGEIGHVRYRQDGVACPCGRSGCFDTDGSGRGLERAYAALTGVTRSGREIVERLATDPAARSALASVADVIGRASAEVVMLLDPAVVVIGGGVSEIGEQFRSEVERSMRASLGVNVVPGRTRVRLAQAGGRAGAVGAADLARSA